MAYPVMENTLFYSNCFDDFPVFQICIENCLRYVNSSVIEWWEYVTPYHFVHILSHKRYGVFPRIFVQQLQRIEKAG